MPSALMLNTPPSTASKRQRSRETRDRKSEPTAAGQSDLDVTEDGSARLARNGIRMPPYLEKTRAEINAAFVDLEWQQRARLSHALNNPSSSPFRTDRSPLVLSRNRYMNVQPWESSRVKLKIPLGGSDYVNASPIRLKSRSAGSNSKTQTYLSQKTGAEYRYDATVNDTKYIATQGPKEGQFPHFWHMVMQETTGDIGVIVMLTQCYEGNKEKCARYFPGSMEDPIMMLPAMDIDDRSPKDINVDDGDPFLDSDPSSTDTDSDDTDTSAENDSQTVTPSTKSNAAKTDSGTVELLSVVIDASIGCEVRRLMVTIGNNAKLIYHYLYNDWVDLGRPEAEDRLALSQLTRVSKKVVGNSPRIVHCSAGVGRTGTWIALDFLLRELEEGRLLSSSIFNDKQELTESASSPTSTWGKSGPAKASTPEAKSEDDLIYETVNMLREQRMMMVMNELQFSFLYETLKEAFVEKYAEKQTGPVVLEEPTPKVLKRGDSFGGMYEGTKVGNVRDDGDAVSEAETEIMDHWKAAPSLSEDVVAGEVDPYAAVSPEGIRLGMESDKAKE